MCLEPDFEAGVFENQAIPCVRTHIGALIFHPLGFFRTYLKRPAANILKRNHLHTNRWNLQLELLTGYRSGHNLPVSKQRPKMPPITRGSEHTNDFFAWQRNFTKTGIHPDRKIFDAAEHGVTINKPHSVVLRVTFKTDDNSARLRWKVENHGTNFGIQIRKACFGIEIFHHVFQPFSRCVLRLEIHQNNCFPGGNGQCEIIFDLAAVYAGLNTRFDFAPGSKGNMQRHGSVAVVAGCGDEGKVLLILPENFSIGVRDYPPDTIVHVRL